MRCPPQNLVLCLEHFGSVLDFKQNWESGKFQLARWSKAQRLSSSVALLAELVLNLVNLLELIKSIWKCSTTTAWQDQIYQCDPIKFINTKYLTLYQIKLFCYYFITLSHQYLIQFNRPNLINQFYPIKFINLNHLTCWSSQFDLNSFIWWATTINFFS